MLLGFRVSLGKQPSWEGFPFRTCPSPQFLSDFWLTWCASWDFLLGAQCGSYRSVHCLRARLCSAYYWIFQIPLQAFSQIASFITLPAWNPNWKVSQADFSWAHQTWLCLAFSWLPELSDCADTATREATRFFLLPPSKEWDVQHGKQCFLATLVPCTGGIEGFVLSTCGIWLSRVGGNCYTL